MRSKAGLSPLGSTGAAIRPVAAGDLPALQTVRAATFAPVFASFRKIVGPEVAAVALAGLESEQAALLADICADAARHHPHAAVIDGRIVGFVSFTSDAARRIGEIGLTAVHPDYAGKGVGTAMIEFALDRLRTLGAAVVEVGTGGDPSHAAARRAYEKAGFAAAIPSVHMYRML